MDISIFLSIIAIIISSLTLLFYLFQEYKDLFTIYWFAEYDVVYIPIVCEDTLRPMDFIEKYQKEFHRNLGICEFKKQWIGSFHTVYYHQSLYDYIDKIDDLSLKSLFIAVNAHKYFMRVIITHKGKKAIKQRIKSIRKTI